jgi:tetratricopeptide (TPR) repeat protein
VILVLSVLWVGRNSWGRPLFFALSFFLLALLPTLGLAENYIFRYSPVFDHFQYLASMGPLALAGAAVVRLADLARVKGFWLRLSPACVAFLVLGLLSWQRAWAYEDNQTLWTDTVAENPDSPVAHYNLGNELIKTEGLDQAMAEYEKAVALDPGFPEAHHNLGVTLMGLGRSDEAIAEYRKALEINPNFPDAHNDLGMILLKLGRTDEALAECKRAVELNPRMLQAHCNLGNALLQQGRTDEAIVEYQDALKLDPGEPNIRHNLIIALRKAGRIDEANDEYQKMQDIAP